MASQSDIEAAVEQAWSRLRSDFSVRYNTLIRDMESLRTDITVLRGDFSNSQRDATSLRAEVASLRSDLSTHRLPAPPLPPPSQRPLVEPAVVTDLRFSG